jgi:uncharacterized glyoxalase superfamily protein PhnB
VELAYFSLITADVERLCAFYTAALDRPELEALRAPYFRAVALDGGAMLAISGVEVYDLLNIDAWRDATGARSFATFGVETPTEVDVATDRAVASGARVIHPVYETAYGTRQSVLADLDDNVFRFNAPSS